MLIYILFQPLKIKQQEFGDVPLLTMGNFVMYELQSTGLQTIMAGTKALTHRDKNSIRGASFIYDSINNTMKSKQVTVKYQLKESKI
ncbi:hypothetical protein MNB_SM-4-1306 [hydrothermal vent metagenome]|uniref:Uncharacterized protein n=1 Tax=hydrothermal vent metagenome TaxID=652676 RepID=A0A1W1B9X4_9ZZZZ